MKQYRKGAIKSKTAIDAAETAIDLLTGRDRDVFSSMATVGRYLIYFNKPAQFNLLNKNTEEYF